MVIITGLKITAGQRSLTAESDSFTFEIAVSPIMLTVVEVLSGYFLSSSYPITFYILEKYFKVQHEPVA